MSSGGDSSHNKEPTPLNSIVDQKNVTLSSNSTVTPKPNQHHRPRIHSYKRGFDFHGGRVTRNGFQGGDQGNQIRYNNSDSWNFCQGFGIGCYVPSYPQHERQNFVDFSFGIPMQPSIINPGLSISSSYSYNPLIPFLTPPYTNVPFQFPADMTPVYYSAPSYQDPSTSATSQPYYECKAKPYKPPSSALSQEDVGLQKELLKQIEYYFSNENLVGDHYLRRHMDEQGWVSVDLISSFNRVRRRTNDKQLLLDALKPSLVVEVQGNKMRRRDNWQTWVISNESSSSSEGPVENVLVDTHRG